MGKIIYYWNSRTDYYDYQTDKWNGISDDELDKMNNMSPWEKRQFLYDWGFDEEDVNEILIFHSNRNK